MRAIKKTITFEACGVFGAITKAQKYLEKKGFIVAPLCRNFPVGFAPKCEYDYISKWRDLDEEDKGLLSGRIVSHDFRGSGCIVEFWKHRKEF